MSDEAERVLVLPLRMAVKFEGKEYKELKLEEPTAGQLLRSEEPLRNGATIPALTLLGINMVAMSAGVPSGVVEQIAISELNRGTAFINNFVAEGKEAEEGEGLGPTLTLTLRKSIAYGDRTYQDLILQEPTAKQAHRADEQLRHGASVPAMRNREIHLVSMVSGVPVPVIEKIKISDLNRAMAFINPFLSGGLQTGSS